VFAFSNCVLSAGAAEWARLNAEKRAALNRPRDRNDLLGLAEIHGELPEDEIPELDS
jgi:hypothetical protein